MRVWSLVDGRWCEGESAPGPYCGGATTTFTWDIASGLPVVLDDGNQYVYGAGLTATKQSGSWYYYLADGLGSTLAIVDSSGNSQKSYQYDVYGEVTGGSGSLANEFDFAGQQTDATGLQYLRARYYDPETGTFMSRDPLASRPQWTQSSYAYVEADPTNFTDPSGLCRKNRYFPCLFPDSPDDIGDFFPDVSGAASTVANALQSVNEWLFNLNSGDLYDFLEEAASALALVGEYLAGIGEACALHPVDCYFALEHIAVGVALVELAVAATAATCAASAGFACWFAGLTFLPAGITGLAVVAIGVDEKRSKTVAMERAGPEGHIDAGVACCAGRRDMGDVGHRWPGVAGGCKSGSVRRRHRRRRHSGGGGDGLVGGARISRRSWVCRGGAGGGRGDWITPSLPTTAAVSRPRGRASMQQSGNWFYYLADGLGSTMAIVDSSGNSQKSYQYDVYGEVTGGSVTLPSTWRMTICPAALHS